MERGMPLIGDKFPQLEVKTTHGMVKMSYAYAGKWFVLFSHPAEFTPVCTTELAAFQKRFDEFRKLNCELIKNEVIVPLPSDEKTAKEKVKQYECFDWWFCHKKL